MGLEGAPVRRDVKHVLVDEMQDYTPDASAKNYATEMDRNMLYVACTRAMHRLTLTHVGRPTAFVSF